MFKSDILNQDCNMVNLKHLDQTNLDLAAIKYMC